MPTSIPKTEVATSALSEGLHTGEQLLKEKGDRSQQLFSATESMLKKSEFQQESDEMLLAKQQDELKEEALQSTVKLSQDKLSWEQDRDCLHSPKILTCLKPCRKLMDVLQLGAGAESKSLSSTPSAAGPVIKTSCVEAQMLLPTLASCTASLSGQAEAKVEPKKLSAEPKPSTTGHKKLMATNVMGTVVWFNAKFRYGFIRQDIFVHQTAIKSYNARYYPPSLADGGIVELDVEEGRKGIRLPMPQVPMEL